MVGRASASSPPPYAQVIVVRKLREALLPTSSDKEEKENIDAVSRKGFVTQEYGSVSYWVPAGVTGVPNNTLLT